MTTIHESKYRILEVLDLPEDVQYELECPGNDYGRIINPKYHPKLSKWLKDNGHNEQECFIAWWSW